MQVESHGPYVFADFDRYHQGMTTGSFFLCAVLSSLTLLAPSVACLKSGHSIYSTLLP